LEIAGDLLGEVDHDRSGMVHAELLAQPRAVVCRGGRHEGVQRDGRGDGAVEQAGLVATPDDRPDWRLGRAAEQAPAAETGRRRRIRASTSASNGTPQRTLSISAEVPTTQPASREMTTVRIPYASWNARARE